MSTDRVASNMECVPLCWTALDDVFFTLVGDLLSASFLWGAATLLASYDADAPAATDLPSPSRPGAGLPRQRGLDGWTVDPHGRSRYGAA
jgi:hypothetical protein